MPAWKNSLFLLLLLGASPVLKAIRFDQTRVLVHLSRNDAHDTVGYNLAEALPSLFFNQIKQGKLLLWDGPHKQIKLNRDALMVMDQGNEFSQISDVFLTEEWMLSRKKLYTEIKGFALLGRNNNGEKVNFGYVDMEDVRSLLQTSIIPCNANGYRNLSYFDALMGRFYPFNILQFGTDNFKDEPMNAVRLKLELFQNPKISIHNRPCPNTEKDVILSVYAGNRNEENQALIKSMEQWFDKNREFLFNHSGDQALSHLEKNASIEIGRIQIHSVWLKNEQKLMQRYITGVVFFINNKPSKLFDLQTLRAMDAVVMLQSPEDFLERFSYDFVIERINAQEINPNESHAYKKALIAAPWNQIIYYSKGL